MNCKRKQLCSRYSPFGTAGFTKCRPYRLLVSRGLWRYVTMGSEGHSKTEAASSGSCWFLSVSQALEGFLPSVIDTRTSQPESIARNRLSSDSLPTAHRHDLDRLPTASSVDENQYQKTTCRSKVLPIDSRTAPFKSKKDGKLSRTTESLMTPWLSIVRTTAGPVSGKRISWAGSQRKCFVPDGQRRGWAPAVCWQLGT